MNGQTFKLVCEQCGSLTVALPIEAQPDSCSILKCGAVRLSKRNASVAA